MSTLIHQRVAEAREGTNPFVVGRLPSGWVVVGDVQPLWGYCLLLPDPVVPTMNHLGQAERAAYCKDMLWIGDVLLEVTGAARMNYETLGNLEPALHTHIIPRYLTEAEDKKALPPMMAYPWEDAPDFDKTKFEVLKETLRRRFKECHETHLS